MKEACRNKKKQLTKNKKNSYVKIICTVLLLFGLVMVNYPVLKNTQTILKMDQIIVNKVNAPKTPDENEEIHFLTKEDYANLNPKNVSESDGTVMIPELSISAPLYSGLKNEQLLLGAGTMFPERSFEKENSVILGHHIMVKELLFGNLIHAKKGMKLVITFFDKKYIYLIESRRTIEESDLSVLANTNKPQVTLITCDKPSTTAKRVVVVAQQVGVHQIKGQEQEEKQWALKKTKVRRSIVKYSVLPILITLIIFTLGSCYIWRSL